MAYHYIFVDLDSYFNEKHIKEILSKHPAECVFELDAPKKIKERLSGKRVGWWIEPKNLREMLDCFIASEIYCPHEDIDRREEFGVGQ